MIKNEKSVIENNNHNNNTNILRERSIEKFFRLYFAPIVLHPILKFILIVICLGLKVLL